MSRLLYTCLCYHSLNLPSISCRCWAAWEQHRAFGTPRDYSIELKFPCTSFWEQSSRKDWSHCKTALPNSIPASHLSLPNTCLLYLILVPQMLLPVSMNSRSYFGSCNVFSSVLFFNVFWGGAFCCYLCWVYFCSPNLSLTACIQFLLVI